MRRRDIADITEERQSDMVVFRNTSVHYLNNNPHGVRVVQVAGSVIEVLVVPRELMKEAKEVAAGMSRRGIYFLVEEREGRNLPRMYVGQTQNGIERLYDHKAKKDFWTTAVMFVAKDDHFPLDVISALEKVAIEGVVNCGRYTSDNKVDPKFNIGIFQRQVVEKYFDDIKFVMASLGWSVDCADAAAQGEWHTTRNGITAHGNYAEGKFELLPGSIIDFSRKVNLESYNELRSTLLKEGSIVEDEHAYRLLKIVTFRTPSGASDFVLGGSTNGWTEWKNMKGEKLDSIRKSCAN